jgi:hypothetical protein
MSFCHQCGTELPDGAKFCTNCGAAAGAGATTTGTPPAAAIPVEPARPSSFGGPAATQPVISQSGSGLRWILPAMVAVAAIVIVYLLLAPKGTTPATDARGASVTAETGSRGDAAVDEGVPRRPASKADDGDRRAVDEASDAATLASGNTRAGNTVPAAVLDSAFNSDPAGAAIRYTGPIRVSGTIASMVQPGSTPSLSMEGRTRFNFMIVNFPAGYRERLAPLTKGQFITVACGEVRELGGTTILSGCLLS